MTNAAAGTGEGPTGGRVQRPTLSRQWLIKIGAFLVLLMVFGVWGSLDAAWLYPRRGLADASFQLHGWLGALDQAGRLTSSSASIADPKAALKELRERQSELLSASTGDGPAARAAKADLGKLAYLDSLSKVWRLNTDDKPVANITKPSARRLYFQPDEGLGYAIDGAGAKTDLSTVALARELSEYWKVTKPATPLSGFDMIFQYVFIVAGFGGAAMIALSILRAKAKAGKIAWDPAAKALTLENGVTVTPANFADLDKRLWHKYYADILTTDGAAHRVDLLRYVPLETWVLELEKIKFPERAAQEAAKKAAEQAAQQAAGGSGEQAV